MEGLELKRELQAEDRQDLLVEMKEITTAARR